MHRDRVIAGVLVGGASRRMGSPKALLPHPRGGTFVEHVIRVAQGIADDVCLLGACERLPESLIGIPALPDVQLDQGPLSGLGSLLRLATPHWALLLACDMPRLGASALQHLLVHASAEVDAVAYIEPGERETCHACCALYHSRIVPAADAALSRGRRSLQSLLRNVRLVGVEPSDDVRRQLINVNTLDDLNLLQS